VHILIYLRPSDSSHPQQLGLDLSVNIYAKEDEEAKRLNELQRQRKEGRLGGSDKDGQSVADTASKEM